MNENGKPSMGIVNIVIQKITDFTKEIEILRAQLPEKDHLNNKIDKMSTEFNKMMLAVKVVFTLIGVVVVLSLFGAKLLGYLEDKGTTHVTIEKRIEKIEEGIDDKFKTILDRIEKLHENKQKNNPEQENSPEIDDLQ